MSSMDVNSAAPVPTTSGERGLLLFVAAVVMLGMMAVLAVLG